MDYPVKGVTKREHLESVWNQTDKKPNGLVEPELPERFEKVWILYWDINIGEPITYQELRAYCDLHGEWLSPWEIDQIRFMDSVVKTAVERKRAKEKPVKDGEDGGFENAGTEVQD